MNYRDYISRLEEVLGPDLYVECWLDTAVQNEGPEDNPHLYVRWEVGGTSGGNCWGGQAVPYTSHNTPLELKALDVILLALVPDISLAGYIVLRDQLVDTGVYSIQGYYGNTTRYGYKAVSVKKLYGYLVGAGLL